jgi:hypothetical protein
MRPKRGGARKKSAARAIAKDQQALGGLRSGGMLDALKNWGGRTKGDSARKGIAKSALDGQAGECAAQWQK